MLVTLSIGNLTGQVKVGNAGGACVGYRACFHLSVWFFFSELLQEERLHS